VPITVRLPAMFHTRTGPEVIIDETVSDIAGLRAALDRRFPQIAQDLSDPIFNVAVNDVMLLHGVQQHAVKDGDVVEFVPTIAGG
jgi:molybdopterin converting factor small subunit